MKNSSALLHRNFRSVLPRVVGGEGCYLIDDSGRRYLDASGGAAVSCLGHGHPAVAAAIKGQLDKVAYAHSNFFTSEPAEELARNLTGGEPGGLIRAFFVGGGSEAVEAAIKLSRQYFLEIGQPQRRHIISRQHSYHGNTLGALSLGTHVGRRAPYAPYLFEGGEIANCRPYRDRLESETLEDYGQRVAGELEAEIQRLGPQNVSAFIAETVGGATSGAQPAVRGYFAKIRAICDAHGILLILDEVMSGMGRTGWRYAFEAEGIAPDIVTCAKGLAAGYQPIGAVIVGRKVIDAIADGSGILRHGHTYMAHPVACAAALAVQEAIEADDLLSNVRKQGAYLAEQLKARFGQHPHVGDIRGRGLLMALELVADRATKRPFEAKNGLAERIRLTARDHGLICYPTSGTADGTNGDHVLLAPPYIIDQDTVTQCVDLLEHTLKIVFSTTANQQH
jgi:adenosylmethionine-8-amino-7-oxononanoate aminotransferase